MGYGKGRHPMRSLGPLTLQKKIKNFDHVEDYERYLQRQKKNDFRGIVSLPSRKANISWRRAERRNAYVSFIKGTPEGDRYILVRRLNKDYIGVKPTGMVQHPSLVRKVSIRGEVHYQ